MIATVSVVRCEGSLKQHQIGVKEVHICWTWLTCKECISCTLEPYNSGFLAVLHSKQRLDWQRPGQSHLSPSRPGMIIEVAGCNLVIRMCQVKMSIQEPSPATSRSGLEQAAVVEPTSTAASAANGSRPAVCTSPPQTPPTGKLHSFLH